VDGALKREHNNMCLTSAMLAMWAYVLYFLKVGCEANHFVWVVIGEKLWSCSGVSRLEINILAYLLFVHGASMEQLP